MQFSFGNFKKVSVSLKIILQRGIGKGILNIVFVDL
jgi:hypothetical protein